MRMRADLGTPIAQTHALRQLGRLGDKVIQEALAVWAVCVGMSHADAFIKLCLKIMTRRMQRSID